MSTEETPLLNEQREHNAVYDRFTRRRKRVIVAVVSLAGLLPLFVTGSFVPSIPQIAKELNSTGPVISLAVSLSVMAAAIGSLTCAAYSTFYGRRNIYLVSLPLLCIGSLGVALANSVTELMVWRFVQAFGASAGLSVGSGALGDIYKLEERGTAMGVFFGAVLFGPAIAPLCGGLAAHYGSWRYMQYSLLACGLGAFLAVYFFLPETSHPNTRGVDKMRIEGQKEDGKKKMKWWSELVWVNPLSSLWLLRSPNMLFVSLAGSFALTTSYVLLVPISYTIGERYNISNEAIIGACFLPSGLGNIVGAPLAGRISDRIVTKRRKRRGGKWVPEDRLRASLLGAGLLVPISVLSAGLVIRYVEGKAGLALILVCLFFNGLGADFVLSPSTSYAVDVVHSRSAESIAANTGCRSVFLALATTVILPLINNLGVVGTNAIAAAFGWVGFVMLWVTIRYGDRMRAWVDVGFTTEDNN